MRFTKPKEEVMRTMHLAIGLMLLFLVNPVQAQTMAAAQKTDIEKEVKAAVKQFYDVYDLVDPEAYVKQWSQDNIIGELRATGLETNPVALKKGIQVYVGLAKRKTETLDSTVHILSPEMALVFATTTFTAGVRFNLAHTMIWVKESGAWKLAFLAGAIETTGLAGMRGSGGRGGSSGGGGSGGGRR
jgi:hypothetical protein